MKFSIFSDLHHLPGVFMGGTAEDLALIRDRAVREGCSFVIHAGDFCHGPSHVQDYLKLYDAFPLPVYHCLGNHDTDRTPLAETLRLYHMPADHYFFDEGGYRFIVCNPNYYRDGDAYVAYDMSNYYAFGPYRDYMPPEQLCWLRETIASAPGPCVLISHESFERPDGVKNRDEVQAIILEANRRRPHSVILCINGHHHRDFLRILDGVAYLELNSASYDWVGKKHNLYPEDLCQTYSLMSNTLVYNDPIHAVITLEGSSITIDGMESSMFMGFNRQDTDNPVYDAAGRPVTPRVQSAKLTLG